MYFYKNGGTISHKLGGDPPAEEYIARDPQGIMRHIKNGNIIEELPIPTNDYSGMSHEERELYKDVVSSQMAKDMLYPKYRKKINKPKSMRKIKVVKKCICK